MDHESNDHGSHASTPGPLAGLRIVDMATMMAAPWAATFLADYGADVIKLEHPKTGDHARHFGLSKDGEPVFWKTLGRNKRSLCLDLKSEQGRDVFVRLAGTADAVVENFRPGVMARLGLDYERLSALNPRLIMLSVTGYGQDGPYSDRPGFGTLVEALSGFAFANGHPDGPPTLPPIPLADGVAGAFGAMALMIAFRERDGSGTVGSGSGHGQHIDMSLFEPLARLMEGHVLEYSALGLVRQRMGNSSLTSAPRNAYRAKDGRWVALSASAQTVFERLMVAIGRPELIEDPRFATNHARIEHRGEMDDLIQSWIGDRDRDDVIEELSRSGAAVGPFYSVAELLDDPHVRARGSFETHSDPVLGEVEIPGMVARFSRTPGSVRHLGPAKGSASEEILRELGYDTSEIANLRDQKVVA